MDLSINLLESVLGRGRGHIKQQEKVLAGGSNILI